MAALFFLGCTGKQTGRAVKEDLAPTQVISLLAPAGDTLRLETSINELAITGARVSLNYVDYGIYDIETDLQDVEVQITFRPENASWVEIYTDGTFTWVNGHLQEDMLGVLSAFREEFAFDGERSFPIRARSSAKLDHSVGEFVSLHRERSRQQPLSAGESTHYSQVVTVESVDVDGGVIRTATVNLPDDEFFLEISYLLSVMKDELQM